MAWHRIRCHAIRGGREQNGGFDRIKEVPNRTWVSLKDRQALNRLLVYAKRAPGTQIPPGQLVRSLRALYRMSQRQLARRAGMSHAQVGRIETGAEDPGLRTLSRLIDALFCDLILVPRVRRTTGEVLVDRAWSAAAHAAIAKGYLATLPSRLWDKEC
jgi:DNA-binding XRE family transcriptional regulator